MLIKEIISENVENKLEADLNDLLLMSIASDITEVKTSKIVGQLRGMGYNVSPASVVNFLENNEFVRTATLDNIVFKNADSFAASGSDDSAKKNRSIVRNLAKKAAGKGIEKG